MRLIIRAIVLFALVWIGLLMSGYGILVGSKVNAAGLGLQCHYLTARGTSTAQYLHTNSGIIGFSDCPIFRKIATVVCNAVNNFGLMCNQFWIAILATHDPELSISVLTPAL